jgi:plastocyanin
MIRFAPEFKENPFMSTQLCAPAHRVLFLAFAIGIAFQHPATGDDAWGSIKGRIVYGGDAFVPEKIAVERDPAVCGVGGQVDESLVVSPKNRGIRNIAIWLETRDEIPVHPDFKDQPAKAPSMDNRNCRFEPHMLAVRTGQVFELTNTDPVAHNAAVYARRNTPFSEIIPMNQPLQKKFAKFEALPVRVDCSIHPWMKAWLIVSDHPYVAVTEEDGSFEIQNIPAGEWKFRFWHERPGYVQSLVTEGKPAPLEKGNWVLNIAAAKTLDLGELIAPAEQFSATKK